MSTLTPQQFFSAVVEPLCPATEKLFQPINLLTTDRLRLTLTPDGTHFDALAFNPNLTAWQRDAGRTHNYASHAAQQWFFRVPQKEKVAEGRYKLAATDVTCILVAACWPSEQVEMDDGARIVYEHALLRFTSQTINAQRKALYKLKREVHGMPDDFVEHPDPERRLAPYQKVAFVDCINSGNDCGNALYMEQGTGKTPIVVNAVSYLASKMDRIMRVLIVAPKNVRQNWVNEFRRFSVVDGACTVLRGTQIARVKLMIDALDPGADCKYTAVISSYETVEKSWDAIRMVPWDLIVLDECHYIKSHNAARTNRMLQLRDCGDRRIILTGTPIANRVTDLYTQLEFLAAGMSGFTSWGMFKRFYSVYERDSSGSQRFMGHQNLPLLQERLARCAFMITKDEALPDLPKKVYDISEVTMTSKQRELYLKMQRQLAIEIDEDIRKATGNDDRRMTAQNVLVKLLRLAQITSGFLKWDAKLDLDGNVLEPAKIEWLDDNPKMEALVEDLKAVPANEKTIIWSTDVPVIIELSRRLTEAGLRHVTYMGTTNDTDRAEAERAFNGDPECRIFLANPSAGGVGLNLRGYDPDAEVDHGCNCTWEVFYSQDWSMPKRKQAEDRAHRRGTRRPVRVTDYVFPGTIDEEIRVRVLDKGVDALTIQDLKDVLQRVLNTVPTDDE